MTSLTPDIVDLRNELLYLKKQFGDSKCENTILKVKIRRMQEELIRKNKDLQILLNPQKAINRRVIAEQGNSLILKLRDQIEDLKTQLQVRDFQIKKLHSQLVATRVYDKNAFFLKNVCDDVPSLRFSNDTAKNNLDIYLNKHGDCTGTCSPSPISEFSCALGNLQKNISKIKENCDVQDSKACNTCFMDDAQFISYSPQKKIVHEDLEDLTSYVMQMTLELENLKTNFMQLQRNKFHRSKSAEPKLGSKDFSPKLILVKPQGSTDSKPSNSVQITKANTNKVFNQSSRKYVIKRAFAEKNGENQSRPKERVDTYQQMSDCGICPCGEDTDSVSEIIILEK